MSQAGRFGTSGGGGGGAVDTLTGNTGGAINPDGFGNINVIGNGTNVSVAGGGSTLTISVADASTTVAGKIEIATNAETLTGTSTTLALTPDDLTYKLGTQTIHGVMIGGGATAALSVTAAGTSGTILQSGGAGADPAWTTATYPSACTQGDLIYASAANVIDCLAKDANNSRYLSNQGTGNAPKWDQVNLVTGVTGTLGIGSGGTNATTMATAYGVNYFDGTRIVTTAVGTAGQVLTSNGAGVAPTFQAAGGGSSFTWTVVAGTSQAMAVNNGYISNNAGLVTCTLPATAAVGDVVRVTGKGAGGWLIAQNAGQTIYFGDLASTTGVTGSLASTLTRDTVELVCVTTNNDWNVISSIGNITVA